MQFLLKFALGECVFCNLCNIKTVSNATIGTIMPIIVKLS